MPSKKKVICLILVLFTIFFTQFYERAHAFHPSSRTAVWSAAIGQLVQVEPSITVTSPTSQQRAVSGQILALKWTSSNFGDTVIVKIFDNRSDQEVYSTSVDTTPGSFSISLLSPIVEEGNAYRFKVEHPTDKTSYTAYSFSEPFYVYDSWDRTRPSGPSNISVGKSSSSGPDNKLRFDYTLPTDSDYYSMNIYRSLSRGELGVKIISNASKGYNPGGNTSYFSHIDNYIGANSSGGKVYFTVRAVDMTGNESINTDQYAYSWGADTNGFARAGGGMQVPGSLITHYNSGLGLGGTTVSYYFSSLPSGVSVGDKLHFTYKESEGVWPEGNCVIESRTWGAYSENTDIYCQIAWLKAGQGLNKYVLVITKSADISVSLDTTPPPGPSNVSVSRFWELDPVNKLKFSYTLPTDPDYSSINIYRSTTKGELGTKVLSDISKGYNPGAVTDYFPYRDNYIRNAPSGGTVYFTVRAVDGEGNESTNTDQYSYTWAKFSPQFITVTSPNGGEKWIKGNTYNITWDSTGIDTVNIHAACGRYYEDIVDLPSSSAGGSYSWKVPAHWWNYDRCRVKVSKNIISGYTWGTYIPYDTSDNWFSVIDAQDTQSITVISPNGGEKWIKGNTYNITWDSTGIETVMIHVRCGVGNDLYRWADMIRDVPSSGYSGGSYSWKVPDHWPNTEKCTVQVDRNLRPGIISLFNTRDMSDNSFAIIEPGAQEAPVITSIYPNSGKQGTGRTTMIISGRNFAGASWISGCGLGPVLKLRGFQIVECTEVSDTRIEAKFIISDDAVLGPHSLSLSTRAGGESNRVNFTVIGDATIAVTITSPNGREVMSKGQNNFKIEYNIWNFDQLTSPTIGVELWKGQSRLGTRCDACKVSSDPAFWNFSWGVGSYFDNSGTYLHASAGDGYRIRIVLRDEGKQVAYDDSDASFSIVSATTVAPSITITSPKVKTKVAKGSEITLRWVSGNFGNEARLKVIRNRDDFVTTNIIVDPKLGFYSLLTDSFFPAGGYRFKMEHPTVTGGGSFYWSESFYVYDPNDTIPPSGPSNISVGKNSPSDRDNKLSFGYTLPTDSDYYSINIYRSTVLGQLGTKIISNASKGSNPGGLTGYFPHIDSYIGANLSGGKVYFTVRAVDMTGNESINTDQYAYTWTTPTTAPSLSVDLRVNGSDKPSALDLGSIFAVTWKSAGATECSAYLHLVAAVEGKPWSDVTDLATSGSRKLYAKHVSYGYVNPLNLGIQCFDSSGRSVTDEISVPVIAPSKAPSLTPPEMIHPQDRQILDLESSYIFKVKPIVEASGYQFSFYQDSKLIYDNQRDEGKLSLDGEFVIHPYNPSHSKFGVGEVEVVVSAKVDGSWTDKRVITITLKPRKIEATKAAEHCLPEGTLVKTPDDSKIYIIENCKKKWIKTAEEFERGGHEWSDVRVAADPVVEAYASYLAATANLLRAINQEKVYRIVSGKKLWVPSSEAFTVQKLDWKDVQEATETEVDSYPTARLIRGEDDSKVYFITDNGFRKWIRTEEIFNSYSDNKWEDVVDVGSDVIESFQGVELMRLHGGVKVYKLEESTKRWIKTAEAFNRNKFDWNKIVSVNQTELDIYTEESVIQ